MRLEHDADRHTDNEPEELGDYTLGAWFVLVD